MLTNLFARLRNLVMPSKKTVTSAASTSIAPPTKKTMKKTSKVMTAMKKAAKRADGPAFAKEQLEWDEGARQFRGTRIASGGNELSSAVYNLVPHADMKPLCSEDGRISSDLFWLVDCQVLFSPIDGRAPRTEVDNKLINLFSTGAQKYSRGYVDQVGKQSQVFFTRP